MSKKLNRRSFLKKAIVASTGTTLGLSLEEKILLARTVRKSTIAAPESSSKELPIGKIGNIKITRLICGGNLTSGFAHSRDLIYVSPFMKHYFTDEKVFETWRLCEENGINTAILRVDNHVIRLINKYWHERGGNLQWIAQAKPKDENNLTDDAKRAIDNGAIGVYIQGGVGDKFMEEGRVDLLGRIVEFIKENEVIAGIGAHLLEVLVSCENAGIDPDFYMKTLNSGNYWSAGPKLVDEDWSPKSQETITPEFKKRTHDNIWAITPQQTIDFMKKVTKPWIAFKILGAGAIDPVKGFKYAFEKGADFACVGMFDFQIVEDANILNEVLSGDLQRIRPWMA